MNIKDSIDMKDGSMTAAIKSEIDHWKNEDKIQRLWKSDATLWTDGEENQWTGWLNLELAEKTVPRIETFAQEIIAAGFLDVVVLGMGGSSLCPAMMAETFGKIPPYPRLHILDSTDPAQIRHLEEKIELDKTLFIVSSKSGNTLEPTIFKDYFYARLQTILNQTEVGDRFVAITDPGTALDKLAKDNHFRAVFHGVPSDGGRYSALSNFGMVPAGLMGVDVKAFLQNAQVMQQQCLPEIAAENNPGFILGVILGVAEKFGKNKVTLIVSPEIHALGAWIEQLLAESTGKQGKGIIPVNQEPLGEPAVYSDDRLFIYIRLTASFDPEQDRAISALEQAGFFVVTLHLPDKMHLGAELFRWEFATAVAGSIIGIDPFNQPDVEASKVLALQITTQYEKTGKLIEPHPLISEGGLTLFIDDKYEQELTKQLAGKTSMAGYLRAHLNQARKDDYVNLSAFIEMTADYTALLQLSRVLIRDRKKVATCLGFGPRFLHSTGQAYKGGPNTGIFLQITADHNQDINVPTHHYTFGLVITAQAQADFNVLIKASRKILRIHLGKDVTGGLQQFFEELQLALQVK